jgi:hypothetical protein
MDMNDKNEFTRRAIDVMTAWTTEPSGGDFTRSRLVERVTEEPDGAIKLIFGLITLAGWLLVRLEDATGQDMQSHLQDIARKNL